MSRSSPSRRAVLGSLSVAALMAAATYPARAQDDLVVFEPARATAYLNGGNTADEEAYMHKIAKDWPLRMIFSERKDKEFVANVDLRVTDRRGTPVLSLHDTGPMVYAKLPAGKYHISARMGGVTEARDVTVAGKAGTDVYFHWKGQPKIDPWDGKPLGGKQVPG